MGCRLCLLLLPLGRKLCMSSCTLKERVGLWLRYLFVAMIFVMGTPGHLFARSVRSRASAAG